MNKFMTWILFGVAAAAVAFIGYTAYVASKSPSIIGGGYDTNAPTGISKKRSAPQAVAPIEYVGLRFEAEASRMGYVKAIEVANGKLVWEKQIYTVTYDPNLETDVQDVFITKLSVVAGKLVVENERGNTYTVDPRTGEPLSPLN